MDKSGEHLIVIVRKEDSARAVCKLVCAVSNKRAMTQDQCPLFSLHWWLGVWSNQKNVNTKAIDTVLYRTRAHSPYFQRRWQCCTLDMSWKQGKPFKTVIIITLWLQILLTIWKNHRQRQTDTETKCKCFVRRYQGESVVHKRGGGGRN
jgi:hypothetical protein